jgi:hypothetical protein
MILFPGNYADAIHCSLQIVNVRDAPPFEALAYVWGREDAVSPLLCDNTAISIKWNSICD